MKRDETREDEATTHGVGTASVEETVTPTAVLETSHRGRAAEGMEGTGGGEGAAGESSPTESRTGPEEEPVMPDPAAESSSPDEPEKSPGAGPVDLPLVPGAQEMLKEQAPPGKLPDKGIPSEPSESAASPTPLPPLAPVLVNGLLEDQMGRVKSCYDVARAKSPGLEGVLRLLVRVEGSRVNATVVQNDLSPTLASCVLRAVRSINPPPNDGRLVEIEKEYTFVGTR